MSETMEGVRVASFQRQSRWSLESSIGSIATALLATVCCVGPLVLALLGIGGAGLLVTFEPYRALLTILTLCLLGVGFYFTYRKPGVAAAAPSGSPECACEQPRSNKAGRVVLWIATRSSSAC